MFEIGSTLRQARERRRLGLDQAEAETKIRARYLRALEEEEFDVLPGPAYVKGFLRTYAEHLGLDGTLFVDEYNSRYSDPYRDEELIFPRRRSMPPRDHRHRRESNVVLIALAGIVAVAVLVAVAFVYPTDRPPGGVELPPTDVTTSSTIDSQADEIDPPGNPAISADQARDEADPAEQEATTTAPKPPVKPVRLIVRATGGESWVTVREGVDGEGQTLFNDLLDPAAVARTRRFTSRLGFVIEMGRPDNAALVVNGKVRPSGASGRVVVRPDGEVEPQR